MKALLTTAALLTGVVCGAAQAGGGHDEDAAGWYVGAGAGIQSFEGWNEGSQAVLTLGRKLAYRHPDTPRSSVAPELELTRSIDSVSRRRGGERHEADVTTAGVYLASNTYVTERFFHRARLGVVYRHVDLDPGGSRNQGRIGFGLGAGLALTSQVELVADAGLQYWGAASMLYTGALSARYHF